jgi:hypothetical protein
MILPLSIRVHRQNWLSRTASVGRSIPSRRPLRIHWEFRRDIQLASDDGRIPPLEPSTHLPRPLPLTGEDKNSPTPARLGASEGHGPLQADDSGRLRIEEFQIADCSGHMSRCLRDGNPHLAVDPCSPAHYEFSNAFDVAGIRRRCQTQRTCVLRALITESQVIRE